MKDKDKKEKYDEKETDKKLQEKKYKKKSDMDKLDISPEDINQLLDELKEKYNIKDDNIKIVRIQKKSSPKMIILGTILSFLFDWVVIISLNGYLNYAEFNFLRLTLFSLLFSTIELILKQLMMKYFSKIIFTSFGLVVIPITIISMMIAWIAIGVNPGKNDILILFFILFIVIRGLLKMMLMRKEINSNYKGGKK